MTMTIAEREFYHFVQYHVITGYCFDDIKTSYEHENDTDIADNSFAVKISKIKSVALRNGLSWYNVKKTPRVTRVVQRIPGYISEGELILFYWNGFWHKGKMLRRRDSDKTAIVRATSPGYAYGIRQGDQPRVRMNDIVKRKQANPIE